MSPAPPSSTANVSKQTVPSPHPQPNAQQLQLCAKQPHHTFLIRTQAQSLDDQLIGMASVIFGA